jgi:hypothetical protein
MPERPAILWIGVNGDRIRASHLGRRTASTIPAPHPAGTTHDDRSEQPRSRPFEGAAR